MNQATDNRATNTKDSKKRSFLSPGLSKQDQILFAKRLSFLIRAGVPILESLWLLKNQFRKKSGIKILSSIIEDVSNGIFLSTAMRKFSDVFGDFAVNIIKVGEEGGILSENLNHLAEELKKKQALKKKVVSALIYPIFIVFATLGIVGMLMLIVFPKVLPIFASINVPLPWTTRFLIFASSFLIAYVLWIILGVLVFGSALVLLMRIPKFRIQVQRLLLKAPLGGTIITYYNLANFCRTMGLLLKGEMRLNQGLHITAATTTNLVYRREIINMAEHVNRGDKISTYVIGRKKYFPEMLGHMLAIGETAGNLGETFLYLADMYEQDIDDLTKNMSSLIEPVLMIFMGLLVGFVAVSIITPIYSVTQRLNP